jgi:hypothetical protein
MRRFTERNRRGFAATVAVVMIGLVGATLLAMSSIFAIEARRARGEASDAQLRQLLLAGAAQAAQIASAGAVDPAAKPVNVPLPQTLAQQGGRLVLTATQPKDGRLEIAVEASVAGKTRRQTLAFTNTAGPWRLVSATLGDAATERSAPPAISPNNKP